MSAFADRSCTGGCQWGTQGFRHLCPAKIEPGREAALESLRGTILSHLPKPILPPPGVFGGGREERAGGGARRELAGVQDPRCPSFTACVGCAPRKRCRGTSVLPHSRTTALTHSRPMADYTNLTLEVQDRIATLSINR